MNSSIHPHHSVFAPLLSALILIVSPVAAPLARAQAVGDSEAAILTALFNEGMQAFNAQKWTEATAAFEKLIGMAKDPLQIQQLAPVFYTRGAAYFNQPDYPKAIEAFKEYLAKFPQHEKVLEVRIALAQSHLSNKNYPEALKLYQDLEKIPSFRERALAAQVQAYKLQGRKDEAAKILEKLAGGVIETPMQARGAIQLAEFYADAELPERAVEVLKKVSVKPRLIDNLVSLNTVAVKLGDAFLSKSQYPEALAAYRTVRPRDEVLQFQKERIAAFEARIEANKRAAAANPALFVQAQLQNSDIENLVAEGKTLLEEFEKIPDYAASLLIRQARCWYDWGKKWETLVVYDRLLTRYPESNEREQALYGIVVTYADLSRVESTQAACERYLKEFPDGPNAGTVGYLMGAVSLQAGDPVGAENFFGIMIEKQPKSEYREEMRFLLGNAKFAQGKWDEALKEYEKYAAEYPSGGNLEEAAYRIAVTHLFSGEYEPALKLLNAYVARHPDGLFTPDARYRIAVCYYAAEQYDEVIKQVKAWEASYPKDEMKGEVVSLLGDALLVKGDKEGALDAYVRSFKAATTDEVLNYSLFEASKLQQKLGKWQEMAAMFEDFAREKPDHPTVVAAVYWIAKAKSKLGQTAEAKDFLVEHLKKYINDPKREAVEQILSQLASMCSKRPRPPQPGEFAEPAPATVALAAPDANAPPPAAPSPSPPPPEEPEPFDPYQELEKQLAPVAEIARRTGQARLIYAQAEMASLKRDEEKREKLFLDLSAQFTVDELSPVLLARVGDYLLGKTSEQNKQKAGMFFRHLKENYLTSDYLDFAYVGLGELAFEKKDYAKALELYTDALEKAGASLKLKEATIGKARALLELERYDEAKPLFEQVASIREWRGEATAMSVYYLGEIQRRQNNHPEAIAFYRRVFVAYQKYATWVARSYIGCAQSFSEMGRQLDAVNNLREMLRNEKLAELPEAREARRLLERWGMPA